MSQGRVRRPYRLGLNGLEAWIGPWPARASAAGVCGADSGVRPTQQPGCGRESTAKKEDTGHMNRGQSRNIPQCLAEPRLTGVFYPCDLLERAWYRWRIGLGCWTFDGG